MPTERALSDALPFLDELPLSVVERAAELAGLDSVEALRTQSPSGAGATNLARAIATACLEDPQRSLERTSVGVVIPCRSEAGGGARDEGLMTRLVTVYGLPEMGGLSLENLLAWLLELAIRSKVGEVPVERAGSLFVGDNDELHAVNLHTASSLLVALQEIAAWAYLERGENSVLRSLRAQPVGPLPSEVSRAFATLDALASTPPPLPGKYGRYDLAQAFADLEANVGPRSWEVFVQRQLAAETRPTLESLGQQLGVTRERIRQLESQAQRTVSQMTADPKQSVLRRAAERLHNQLGEVARASDLQSALTVIDPSGHALEGHPERTRLLLSLAGPYTHAVEWILKVNIAQLVRVKLREATSQHPLNLEDAVGILESLGVRRAVCSDWLEELPGFRTLAGWLVRWEGSMVEKAETILRVTGEPMTVADIFEAIGENRNVRSLRNRIQGDARFMRRGLEHYGLRAWGGEEYSTIVDEIQQEIERQGGEATLEHLVSTLTSSFGVSDSSVRTYAAQHPLFDQTERGTICLRESGTHTTGSRRPLEETRGCFRLQGGWALRLVVNADTLRGSGASIPTALAEHVGLTPRTSRDFESDSGTLHVGWPSIQPQIGSQSRAAEALGAREGDLLFIEFVENRVCFHGVARQELDEAGGIERLAREMGADANEPEPFAWVCRALSVDQGDQDALATIRRRLTARKEQELAAFVPQADLTEPDRAILDILASLGE